MEANLGPAYSASKANRMVVLFLPVLVFATVCLARVVYVSLYAAPLPFWDQWDELDRQLRPWLKGNWHFLHLFAPHNEHRIAFTRSISLLLACANHHVFDNLVEAYANILIYASMWAALCALLIHGSGGRALCWLIAIAAIALGSLPFDWENTLVGFQNAFYLVELFAVVVVGVAAFRAPSLGSIVALAALTLASVFTMGSGLLAAPAACITVVLRARGESAHRRHALFALVAMVLVTAFGLALLLHSRTHDAHAAFGAQGPAQLITALLVCLMWPLQHPLQVSHWLFAGILWIPSIVWVVSYCRSRRREADEVFAFALAVWVLLQCFAIAEARGHDMRFLASRYSEIPAIGIIANLWLALKLVSGAETRKQLSFGVALACAVALVVWVFWTRTPEDLHAMRQRHTSTTIETSNVRHYFAGQPLPLLPEGSLDLPYPSAVRLRDLLDSPEIRNLLPPAAFPPSALPHHDAPLSSFAALLQNSIRAWFPTSAWAVDAKTLASSHPSKFRAYNGPIPARATNTQCSLDAIDGKPSVSVGVIGQHAAVLFQGWAGNGEAKSIRKGVLILNGAHGAYAAPFVTSVERSDVAEALHSRAMLKSGFNLTALISHIPSGTYSLLIASSGHPATACDTHRVLTVQ